MRNLWRVSWHNLTRNKKRFAFTLIAIVMGVVLTTSMLIANDTVKHTMEYHEKLYAGHADYMLLSHNYSFPYKDVQWIREQEDVLRHLSVLDKQGFVDLEDISDPNLTSVRLSGLSSYDSGLLELALLEGDLTQEGLILPENAARLWGKQVGDTVTFKDMGTIEVTAIVGYSPWLRSPVSWEEAEKRHFRVMVPLTTLQQWSGLEEQISYFRFQLDPQLDKDTQLADYQEKLSDSSLFIQPVVIDDRQNNDVEGIYYLFYIVAVISLFISGFIVFNMLLASVMERKKEFAVMKSLGYLNANIYRLVLMEVFILSLMGVVIGIPLGIWFSDLFLDLLFGVFEDKMVYTLQWQGPVILSLIVGLSFPLLSSCIPMYMAGKTPILQAIRRQRSHGNKKLTSIRWLVGLICLGGGIFDHVLAFLLLLIGMVLLYPYLLKGMKLILEPLYSKLLGYPGKLAAQNIGQHLNRNANTSAMLASGICLVLFLGASFQIVPNEIEKEIEATYGGDVHVQAESPWNTEDIKQISSISGVAAVEPYHEAPLVTWETVKQEKRQFPIMSFKPKDPDFHVFISDGSYNDIAQLFNEPKALLLGERAFDEWGGRINDSIKLNTPHGQDEHQVVGVVSTSHYNGYVAFVPEAQFAAGLNWPFAYKLMLKAEDSAKVQGIVDQLWAQYGDRLSSVKTIDNEIASKQSALPGVNNLMQALLILVICLSSIGIGNTLLMNTMERVSEIGTMRATGFTRAQVRRMVIGEGVLIGIAGILAGLLFGIMFIYLYSVSPASGGQMPFVIPWGSVIVSVTAGLVLSVIASWLPASFAARVNLQEALKYE